VTTSSTRRICYAHPSLLTASVHKLSPEHQLKWFCFSAPFAPVLTPKRLEGGIQVYIARVLLESSYLLQDDPGLGSENAQKNERDSRLTSQ
jgi:hypothetical protein